MNDEREEHRPDPAEPEAGTEEPRRPAPRNPFADPEDRELADDRPALIKTRKSAALAGVIVGLVALLFVVLICVASAIAFG